MPFLPWSKWIARLLFCAAAFVIALIAVPTLAAQERYDYDALGRLIRVIDDQGRVTEYVYDPAGNLLQVIAGGTGGGAQVPAITSISATQVRSNRVKTLRIDGSGFTGARVTTSHPNLDIRDLSVTPTSVSFALVVNRSVPLGNHSITLTNAAGNAQTQVTVTPEITFHFSPAPVLPPDSVSRRLELVASAADTESLTLSIASVNATILRVDSPLMTLPAGQTAGVVAMSGLAVGTTVVSVGSATFVEPYELIAQVSSEHASANFALSRPLGIVKGNPADPANNSASGPLLSAPLGVVKGNPADPAANSGSGPLSSAPLGVVKGNPADPAANSTSGPLSSAPLGVVKGNPADPAANSTSGPLLSAPVGVSY